MPQPTFAFDQSTRILHLDHPAFIAEWTVRDSGRIDFTKLETRADSTDWIAPQPHEPIALVGVEGVGHRFHNFDAPREHWAGAVGDFILNLPGTRGAVRAEVTIDLS